MGRKKNAGAGANGSAQGGESVSKTEAVRQALKALRGRGKKISLDDLDGYIREHFGVEMSRQHLSTTKSNILRGKGKKRRGKKAEKPAGEPAANAATTFDVKDMREIRALVDRVGVEKFKDLRQFREVLDVLYP